jgi:hypothetical protein
MAHAVPSQVRQSILRLFPDIEAEPNQQGQRPLRVGTTVHAALELLNRIPDELIRLPANELAEYFGNVSALRGAWEDRNKSNNEVHDRELIPRSGHSSLFEIQRLLARCPDQGPAPQTTGLDFLVSDRDLREALRTDISSANSALTNHGYKEATVIAGSVVEALLLWALEKHGDKEVRQTAKSAPKEPLNEWTLGPMIEAAHSCKLISNATKTQAGLAKTFRNLIHPGRAARLKERCDRGTALGALAAVEMVAADLAKPFPQPQQ